MKFDDLTPEQQEMFLFSMFHEGNTVDYCLFWVWDWETLELITTEPGGIFEVQKFNTEEELSKHLLELDKEHREWLEGMED